MAMGTFLNFIYQHRPLHFGRSGIQIHRANRIRTHKNRLLAFSSAYCAFCFYLCPCRHISSYLVSSGSSSFFNSFTYIFFMCITSASYFFATQKFDTLFNQFIASTPTNFLYIRRVTFFNHYNTCIVIKRKHIFIF